MLKSREGGFEYATNEGIWLVYSLDSKYEAVRAEESELSVWSY